jgi:hypothetical protein
LDAGGVGVLISRIIIIKKNGGESGKEKKKRTIEAAA